MKRFTRLFLGFSKKLENLEAACAMFLAYCNFVPRTRLPAEGRLRLPAAMAARVVTNLWTFENLFDAVMSGSPAIAAWPQTAGAFRFFLYTASFSAKLYHYPHARPLATQLAER